MTSNQRFFTALLIIAVVVICVLCPAVVLVNKALNNATAAQEVAQPTYFVVPNNFVASPTPTVLDASSVTSQEDDGYRKFRKDASWIGDDFGPEMTLPGTVTGPAIAELKSYMGSVCGLVKVNKGETLVWPGGGAFWQAGSQLALDARWPHHKDEYINHYTSCNVYSSAVNVPNPTK